MTFLPDILLLRGGLRQLGQAALGALRLPRGLPVAGQHTRLYCIVPHRTVPYYTVLYYNLIYYTILYYTLPAGVMQ